MACDYALDPYDAAQLEADIIEHLAALPRAEDVVEQLGQMQRLVVGPAIALIGNAVGEADSRYQDQKAGCCWRTLKLNPPGLGTTKPEVKT